MFGGGCFLCMAIPSMPGALSEIFLGQEPRGSSPGGQACIGEAEAFKVKMHLLRNKKSQVRA